MIFQRLMMNLDQFDFECKQDKGIGKVILRSLILFYIRIKIIFKDEIIEDDCGAFSFEHIHNKNKEILKK
jgi:hypothetical protein